MKVHKRLQNGYRTQRASADTEHYERFGFFADAVTIGNHFVQIIVLDEGQIAPFLPALAAIVHNVFISLSDECGVFFKHALFKSFATDCLGHHVVVIQS